MRTIHSMMTLTKIINTPTHPNISTITIAMLITLRSQLSPWNQFNKQSSHVIPLAYPNLRTTVLIHGNISKEKRVDEPRVKTGPQTESDLKLH